MVDGKVNVFGWLFSVSEKYWLLEVFGIIFGIGNVVGDI